MFKPKIYDKYGNEIIKIDIIPNLKNYNYKSLTEKYSLSKCNVDFIQVLQYLDFTCQCSICGAKAYYIALVLTESNNVLLRLYRKDGEKFNIDHIIPKSKNGSDVLDNKSLTCEDCNCKKSSDLTEGQLIIVKNGKFVPFNDERLTFYRVEHTSTKAGFWYHKNGKGQDKLQQKLANWPKQVMKQMPKDPEIKGFLSACLTLDELYKWFPKEVILFFQKRGYKIAEYQALDYKFYEKEQHWLINQQSSHFIKYIKI